MRQEPMYRQLNIRKQDLNALRVRSLIMDSGTTKLITGEMSSTTYKEMLTDMREMLKPKADAFNVLVYLIEKYNLLK